MTSLAERIEACLASACSALNEAAMLHTEANKPFGKDFLYRIGEGLAAGWEARQTLHAHCPELIPKEILAREVSRDVEAFHALVARAVSSGPREAVRQQYLEFVASADPGSYLRRVAKLRIEVLELIS